MKIKIFGLLVALAVVGGLVVFAAHATGAYFSDSHNGTLGGTVGNIKLSTAGGIVGQDQGIDFAWNNMLPGVVYSAPMQVTNTSSSNAEDLYMVFPNLTALSALNQLGTYGAVTITVNGANVFQSTHLNDNTVRGNTIGWGGALPSQLLLASNVPANSGAVSVIFKFEYAAKMTAQEPGGLFNQYPVLASAGNPCLTGDAVKAADGSISAMTSTSEPYMTSSGASDSSTNTYYAQVTVNPSDIDTSGLPFQIVATEPGIAPNTPGMPGAPTPSPTPIP
jgi:hypothetical protein